MVNFYSKTTTDKIKDMLGKKKVADIPIEDFRVALMRVLGLTHKHSEVWIKNYEDMHIIRITKQGELWVVNWL